MEQLSNASNGMLKGLLDLQELNLSRQKLTGLCLTLCSACRSGCTSTTTECLLVLMHSLAGEIPDSFGNLVNLEILSLWGNQLTGAR